LPLLEPRGFLDTNLINQLVDRGHEITAIDRVRSDKSRQEGVTWVQADVLDPESLVCALDGAEMVYHLVAMTILVQQDDRASTINTVGVGTVAGAKVADRQTQPGGNASRQLRDPRGQFVLLGVLVLFDEVAAPAHGLDDPRLEGEVLFGLEDCSTGLRAAWAVEAEPEE
jgi:hypothetical protein